MRVEISKTGKFWQ